MDAPSSSPVEPRLRIGVVGAGARSTLALLAERADNNCDLVAVCEPHAQARDRVRSQFVRDLPTYPTTGDLIGHGVDAAFVTSPDDTHAVAACELLERGVAVYLEKPLAITLASATTILETAWRTGTKLYVGHNMRHMSVVRLMRDIIQRGEIGEVKSIWCRHFVGAGGDFYFKDWHATREHGNGLLLQKGAHDFDVMHWLANSHSVKVVGMGDLTVYDKVADRTDHSDELMTDWYSVDHWPPLEQRGLNPTIDVEDLSMVLMRMDSGVLASYEQCHYTPDYWRNYTVIGTAGRLENFGDSGGGVVRVWNRPTIYNREGDATYPIPGDSEGHLDADGQTVAEFLRFIRHGGPTDNSPLWAWYAAVVGIQATESIRDGSAPRDIPALAEPLIQYFERHQVRWPAEKKETHR